jgi:hypothetical protein
MKDRKEKYKLSQVGISLVELAMVTLVAALIVGAIITYKDFVHALKLRSIITEASRLKSGVNDFKDKYFALPGDMTLAYSYWGAQCGGNSDAANGGCNGNGDRAIDWVAHEGVKAWQHMTLAKIVAKNYDGNCSSGGCAGELDVNIPASDFIGGGWYLDNSNLTNYENVLGFAKSGYFSVDGYGILSTEEAHTIDLKLDDSLPKTGIVQSPPYSSPCITVVGVGQPDAYDLDESQDAICQLSFYLSNY